MLSRFEMISPRRLANQSSIAALIKAAITGGGNDNLFEHNTIEHACFETIDTGAFCQLPPRPCLLRHFQTKTSRYLGRKRSWNS